MDSKVQDVLASSETGERDEAIYGLLKTTKDGIIANIDLVKKKIKGIQLSLDESNCQMNHGESLVKIYENKHLLSQIVVDDDTGLDDKGNIEIKEVPTLVDYVFQSIKNGLDTVDKKQLCVDIHSDVDNTVYKVFEDINPYLAFDLPPLIGTDEFYTSSFNHPFQKPINQNVEDVVVHIPKTPIKINVESSNDSDGTGKPKPSTNKDIILPSMPKAESPDISSQLTTPDIPVQNMLSEEVNDTKEYKDIVNEKVEGVKRSEPLNNLDSHTNLINGHETEINELSNGIHHSSIKPIPPIRNQQTFIPVKTEKLANERSVEEEKPEIITRKSIRNPLAEVIKNSMENNVGHDVDNILTSDKASTQIPVNIIPPKKTEPNSRQRIVHSLKNPKTKSLFSSSSDDSDVEDKAKRSEIVTSNEHRGIHPVPRSSTNNHSKLSIPVNDELMRHVSPKIPLFDDDLETTTSITENKPIIKPLVATRNEPPKIKARKPLFDDSDDNDDGLFTEPKNPMNEKKKTPESQVADTGKKLNKVRKSMFSSSDSD